MLEQYHGQTFIDGLTDYFSSHFDNGTTWTDFEAFIDENYQIDDCWMKDEMCSDIYVLNQQKVTAFIDGDLNPLLI